MVDKPIYQPPVLPPGTVGPAREAPQQAPDKTGFEQALRREVARLTFSGHAEERLRTRNIELSEADLVKLDQAVDKASQKGARDSLVLLNDLAFVVSVTNRKVITAMDGSSLKENVFTNIDSAVVVE